MTLPATFVAELAALLLSFCCVVLLGGVFAQMDWEKFR